MGVFFNQYILIHTFQQLFYISLHHNKISFLSHNRSLAAASKTTDLHLFLLHLMQPSCFPASYVVIKLVVHPSLPNSILIGMYICMYMYV